MLGLSLALSAVANAVVAVTTRALKFNLSTNSQYVPVIGA